MPIAHALRIPGQARLRKNGITDIELRQAIDDQHGKISEMINPDGSVTVRRKVFNTDGSSSIVQEEYCSLDRRILGKSDGWDNLPCLEQSSSFSSSSASTIKTSPSRAVYLSSDRSGSTSVVGVMVGRNTEQRSKPPPVDQDSVTLAFKTDSTRSMTSSQPADPVRFENRTSIMPVLEPSLISLSSWGVPDADLSGISGDSMGYPALDTSTAFYENNDESDDDTAWSMLQDEVFVRNESAWDIVSGEAPLLNRRGTSDESLQGRIPYGDRDNSISDLTRHDTLAVSSYQTLTSKASHSSHQTDLAVTKQASSLAKPKTTVRFYADPGIASTTNDHDRDDWRDKGALFDAPSTTVQDERSDLSEHLPNENIVFTVRKKSLDDKIGMFVGVHDLPGGPQLVVSKVSPSGKFAESPIATGDIVVSINGKDFLRNPRAEEALDIVRRATDKVTFVVLKNRDHDLSTSMDDFSFPVLPYHGVSEIINDDQSKTVTREVKNNDGSQTIILECFDPSGRKIRQATRRRWINLDGVTRDISTVSLTFTGELAILVKKTIPNQTLGLRLVVNETHRGHRNLVVSQVFPSGLFARTPLSSGDTITSINGVDFTEKPDLDRAVALLSKTAGDVSIRAFKSKDWIERSQRHFAQSRRLEETFTIPTPMSKLLEFDTMTYGGSTLGYQSAKKLTLRKFSALEGLGIIIKSQPTKWGVLLVATALAQSSPLSAAGLQKGDIILSINGVNFREEPDADNASNLIRNTGSCIEMEYQHLDDPVEQDESVKITTKQIFKPDGSKCIRTETRNPDGSILVKLEEIGPEYPLDIAIEKKPSSFVMKPDMSQVSAWDGLTAATNTFRDHRSLAPEEVSVPTCAESSALATNPLEPVTITVNKTSKSQDVGISLFASKGALYVKKISSGGLLVGKPILPGDTVVAINDRDFCKNPSVRNATSTISNASKTISFRILKTSLRGNTVEVDMQKKSVMERLFCSSRAKHSTEISKK